MAAETVIFSHWSMMIQGLQASPKEFLAAVEEAVIAKELKQAKHSRMDLREGGVFSAKREYLRIRRKDHAFDVCGAPFGNGFFVSWWLGEIPSKFYALLLRIPFISLFVAHFIKPQTYYRADTAAMFQSLVHSAVMQVIDDMTEAKGLRTLSDTERTPKMRSFFA